MHDCFAEKVIEIYKMKKDSSFKTFHLTEKTKISISVSKHDGSFSYTNGRVDQITDSFLLIKNEKIYYDNIAAITFRVPEKKHIAQKIVAGVLCVPIIISVGITAIGVDLFIENKHEYDWEEGIALGFWGGVGFLGSIMTLSLDLNFKTHFSLYKLHPLESQATHRWFLRVVEKQKK